MLSTDLGPNEDEWFGATNGLLLTPSKPGQTFGKVHLSGEEIGKFSQAQARLEIVFTGTVSRAEVNQTLRSLNYTNLDKQARSEATITWEFFDNETGGNKVSGTSQVKLIHPTNQAPSEVRLSKDSVEENSNTQSPLAIGVLSSVDADTDEILAYAATMADGAPLPDWLTFTVEEHALTFHGEAPDALDEDLAIRVTVTDRQGLSTYDDFNLTVSQAPAVHGIVRAEGASSLTNQDSLIFLVTFSEAVNGVTLDDFELITGGSATGTLSSVERMDESGAVYAVTVDVVSGDGTVGLGLEAADTDIISVKTGLELGESRGEEEAYQVDNTPPSGVLFSFRMSDFHWQVTVDGVEDGASWYYSLDGGASWQTGEGSGFTTPLKFYAVGQVQFRQVDAAGNQSAMTSNETRITPRPSQPEQPVPPDEEPDDPSADLDGDSVPDGLEVGLGLTPGVKDNDVFARNDLFVMQVYRDAFGREAEDAGLDYWQKQLEDSDLSRENFVRAMLSSDEAQDAAPLVRLSLGLLDRSPDVHEMQAWRAELAAGMSRAEVIDAFVQDQYGDVDDTSFVSRLHEDIFSRQASETEVAYWIDILGRGQSRGEVALDLTFSDEFLQDRTGDVEVAELYLALLGREADSPDLDYWSDAIESGMPVGHVIMSMMAADEYHDRFLPNAVSDDGMMA